MQFPSSVILLIAASNLSVRINEANKLILWKSVQSHPAPQQVARPQCAFIRICFWLNVRQNETCRSLQLGSEGSGAEHNYLCLCQRLYKASSLPKDWFGLQRRLVLRNSVTLGCPNYSFEDRIDANRLFLTSELSRSDLLERQMLGERMYLEFCKVSWIPSAKQYQGFLEFLVPTL